MNNKKGSVIIIGGGWAGLSAAIKLTEHGHPVTLFESAKQLGGRARCVAFNKQPVDNGQHLMLGAYTQTLDILNLCGVNLANALLRETLNIYVLDKRKSSFTLAPNRLPAPLNILFAFMTLPNVNLKDRMKTILFLLKLRVNNFKLKSDITVKKLLHHQPEVTIKMLWEPLCIAALNTTISEASAKIFLNVLKDSFTRSANASDLLIPKQDLGTLFVQPAMRYIEDHGGTILLGNKVDRISYNNIQPAVTDVSGNEYHAKHIVLAGSPQSTLALLEKSDLFEKTQQQLRAISYEPICTVYLQYEHDVRLSQTMIGLTGCTGQWIFDRHCCGQPGLMAVVISASGSHMQLDKMTLAQLINDELSAVFGWPDALKSFVIREKRATFKSHVDIDKLRPSITTSKDNLWLCGDYTAGPYPATLEAAVQSGVQCSQEIIQSMK